MKKVINIFVLPLLILTALSVRIYGVLWDQGQHLHPDERFLVMVTNAVSWPTSLTRYFDTSSSPLNPHNVGYPFFVYGTFPLVLVKYLALNFRFDDYYRTLILGRLVSAVFDTGTVVVVYLSSRLLFRRQLTAFLSALFYTFSVLPVQLAHFYTVDSFLVFFLVLSFYFLIRLFLKSYPLNLTPVLLGISFALAISCKISAVLFAPVILLCLFLILFSRRSLFPPVLTGILILVSGYFSLRIFQPYLFSGGVFWDFRLNSKILSSWHQLQSFNHVRFPPSVQWLFYPRLVYAAENNLLWGLGLPLGILSFGSLIYLSVFIRRFTVYSLPVFWVLLLYTYQAWQFAQPLRYFASIYPFLAIAAGFFVGNFLYPRSRLLTLITVFISLIYPLSFLSIYSRPHSRVAASDWIYRNIPSGSRIYCEEWDDCLPLTLNPLLTDKKYSIVTFPIYDLPDSPDKWEGLNKQLMGIDYIILSSNRLYASITSAPSHYPLASQFYSDLFRHSRGFFRVVEFTSRPNLPIPFFHLCLTPPGIRYGKIAAFSQDCPLPGISFVDDYADETFTVYDHPKVIIFQRDSSRGKI